MTPEEQGDVPEKTVTKDEEFADGYERRKARQKMHEMEAKIEELESRLTERDYGIDDKTPQQLRSLIEEQRRMKEEFDTVLRSAMRTTEDEKLEPYMQRVLDEHGRRLEKAYPNRIERLEAMRTMARGYEAQESQSKSTVGGRRESATPARVHLAGGGPSASRRVRTDANDFAEFQAKLRDPKLTADEKFALAQKYEAEHPEE